MLPIADTRSIPTRRAYESEIRSKTIGELVMDALNGLDPVAYVRFASVYRNFRETRDFEKFIDELGTDGD